jgi:dephospho-CoA kinase
MSGKRIKTLQVGITGGIGAGKSIACKVFEILHIPIYYADDRAKAIMLRAEVKSKLKAAFGPATFLEDGQLNKSHLAQLAFSDQQVYEKLNAIVHPLVREDYEQWKSEREGKYPYVLREAAIMIESGAYKTLDYLIMVTAPENLRIERTLQRDPHRTQKDIEAIMKKQMSEEERMPYVDFVIHNDNTQLLIPQVLKVHQLLLAK